MPLTQPSHLARGVSSRVAAPRLQAARDPERGQVAVRLRDAPWRGVLEALERWHLLSLDAPTVATLWTAIIARGAGVHLPAEGLAAMFSAVWMVYAGDRLLDAQPLRGASAGTSAMDAELEPRHFFHRRHRRVFLVALAAVTLVLPVLLQVLTPTEMRWQLLLGALLVAYFWLIHGPVPRRGAPSKRLPKELVVGVFFAAATSIPTLARCPQMCWPLLPVAVLFAALCSLNCAAIYKWEHQAEALPARAHPLTCFGVRHLRALLVGLLCAALAFVPMGAEPVSYAAIALAAALLLLLDAARGSLRPITLRALGDLVLATPALLWPLLR